MVSFNQAPVRLFCFSTPGSARQPDFATQNQAVEPASNHTPGKSHFLTLLQGARAGSLSRWLWAMSLALVCCALPLATVAQADDEDEELPIPPGLCLLGENGSGRWVELQSGELLPLRDICLDPATWGFYSELYPPLAVVSTTEQDQQFWQTFNEVASPEAIAVTNTVSRASVLTYGQSICPMLNGGKTLEDVRAVQLQGGMPPEFDAAVNVAAIYTYCPEYTDQIGG